MRSKRLELLLAGLVLLVLVAAASAKVSQDSDLPPVSPPASAARPCAAVARLLCAFTLCFQSSCCAVAAACSAI
jgi:hypothetical protein